MKKSVAVKNEDGGRGKNFRQHPPPSKTIKTRGQEGKNNISLKQYNNMSTFTNLLDGKGTNRGQGQEGKFLIEYEQFLLKEYAHLAAYISITEMDQLFDAEHTKGLSTRERIIKRERSDLIYSRVPFEKLVEEQNAKLNILKIEATKKKTHAAYELGAREFTLTYSPKWCDDKDARIEMARAIDKLCKYYSDEIISLRAVGEVGSNGLSHIHCFYKLQGGLKITDKNFKRAWQYWNPKKKQGYGFEGGHHATVRCESDFLGYIEKDIEGAWYERIARPPV